MLETAINSTRPESCKSAMDARWAALSTPMVIKRPNDSGLTITRDQLPLTRDRLKWLRRELVRAWRALQSMNLRAAIQIVEQVERACGSLPSFDADTLRGTAQVIRAAIYVLSDDAAAAVASVSKALGGSLSPAQRHLARTIGRYASRHSPSNDGDYLDLAQGPGSGLPRRCSLAVSLDLSIDAAIALRQLRLTPANWIACEALQKSVGMAGRSSTVEIFALTILATIQYEGGDLLSADATIERVMHRPKDSLPLESMIVIYPLRARLIGRDGSHSIVMDHLAEGEKLGEERGCARLSAVCLRERVAFLTNSGDLIGARECMRRLEALVRRQTIGSGELRSLLDVELSLAGAQIELATRPSRELAERLGQLQKATLQRGDIYGSVKIGILLVDAIHRTGAAGEASQLLLDMLRIGAKTGLLQTYVDGGAAVRGLLCELHGRPRTTGTEVALLVRVIVWRLQAAARPIGSMRNRLDRRLPPRQQAVLELIGKGRSNKEIARELNLAPETIKSYVKHIFNKLGTQTRAESVAYAAKLGLLS